MNTQTHTRTQTLHVNSIQNKFEKAREFYFMVAIDYKQVLRLEHGSVTFSPFRILDHVLVMYITKHFVLAQEKCLNVVVMHCLLHQTNKRFLFVFSVKAHFVRLHVCCSWRSSLVWLFKVFDMDNIKIKCQL